MAAFVVPFLCFLGVDFLYKRDLARVGSLLCWNEKKYGQVEKGC